MDRYTALKYRATGLRDGCRVSSVGGALVYRIHFTSQDLARTRVAEAPPPLLELDRAARALQDRGQAVRLDSWRRGVERLSEPAQIGRAHV